MELRGSEHKCRSYYCCEAPCCDAATALAAADIRIVSKRQKFQILTNISDRRWSEHVIYFIPFTVFRLQMSFMDTYGFTAHGVLLVASTDSWFDEALDLQNMGQNMTPEISYF